MVPGTLELVRESRDAAEFSLWRNNREHLVERVQHTHQLGELHDVAFNLDVAGGYFRVELGLAQGD